MLVINGDILTQRRFPRAAGVFIANTTPPCSRSACGKYEIKVPYGVVESEAVVVRQSSEKPTLNFFVNAGIYLLEPSATATFPAGMRFDMTDLISKLIQRRPHRGELPDPRVLARYRPARRLRAGQRGHASTGRFAA